MNIEALKSREDVCKAGKGERGGVVSSIGGRKLAT